MTLIANALEASDGHHGYSFPRGDGNDNLITETASTLTSGGKGRRGHCGDDGTDTHVVQTLRVGGRTQGAGDSSDNTPVVAIEDVRGKQSGGGEIGKGYRDDGTMYALGSHQHGVSQPVAIRMAQTSSNGHGVSEDGTTHTLDGTAGDAVGIAHTVRRLTPVECMRLQSFPDTWFDGLDASDGPIYAALGDAVTVNVIQWIGERMRIVHEAVQRG